MRWGLQQGRADLGQRNSYIDIADREEASLAIHRALKPVFINPLRKGDGVSFLQHSLVKERCRAREQSAVIAVIK